MKENLKIIVGLNTVTRDINLSLDYDNQLATLNGKQIDVDVKSFCSKLLQIVSSWDEKLKNEDVVDGISYFVKISKNNKKYNYEGENKFPDNFDEFITLLKEANVW